jgi:hypothetical protein
MTVVKMRYIDRAVSFKGKIAPLLKPWHKDFKEKNFAFEQKEHYWGPVGKRYSGWFCRSSIGIPEYEMCSFGYRMTS